MKNRNGAVLFITLVILSIVVIVCAGITTMNGRDIFNIKRNRLSTQAYFLSEAGIEEAIQDLYDNKCNFNHFPKNKNLGNGSFTVNLDRSKYDSNLFIKIVSTGTAGDVSRTTSVTVRDTRIRAFSYAALSNNTFDIGANSIINGNVHSNHPSVVHSLIVGGYWPLGWVVPSRATVNGNATSCGATVVTSLGKVTGTAASKQAAVTMPQLNASFWDYYYQLAKKSGNVYNGLLRVTGDLHPANGVVWVNGPVWMDGSFNFTGTIISSGGHIAIGRLYPGTITISPKAGCENFPVLMCKDSYIQIWSNTTLNGLAYAGAYILLLDINKPRSVIIDGAIISGSWFKMFFTNVNYVEPHPPGLGSPAPLEVLNWG